MSGESETVSFQASETQNTIQRILQSCFKLVEAGDIHESDSTISELVNFLDSLSDAALSYPNNEPAQNDAFDALTEIHQYICSPSLAQEAVDAHSFELPKAVSKFSYQFLKKCGLRDMLSILCNTLGYSSNMTKAASYIVPPLLGLSKVFTSNKKCHFEQVQLVVPIILNVLKAVALDSYDSDDTELESVFHRAVGILNSIYEVCNKLALLSASISYKDSTCHLMVLELSQISSYCGLTYMSLLTAFDVETVVGFVFGDKDAHMSCLSHVKHGASLSVVWGLVSEEVAHATKESSVLADIPNTQRFDILKALITNTGSSSMIAIFIDIFKREMHMEVCNITSVKESPDSNNETHLDMPFWTPSILELVESVLRPPRGGPPSLPDASDAVLSALNLYRFVLMTESIGKTNHTGVLSRSNLVKAYNEWLLPLCTLVSGIMTENKNDYD
ncbi:hypothetical protein Ahy_B06g083468 [Arachis hypogaea]|uniref:Aberrant root formation protein n=1 Tax=Arachis hypogaea TaxID=3818 RepID=A0A444YQ29_ARAHY|nr:hypothetical protein Ahy_B06g083468 [Arachis hypogaea]